MDIYLSVSLSGSRSLSKFLIHETVNEVVVLSHSLGLLVRLNLV